MKKRKGAAMIWACLLFLIGSLIVGTLTSWGISYHKKSVNEMSENQAYLTARSGAELVAKEIVNATDIGKDIIDRLEGDKAGFTIDNMNFGNNMGFCKVMVKMEEDLVKITSTTHPTAESDIILDTVKINVKGTGKQEIRKLFLGEDITSDGAASDETIWQWKKDSSGKEQNRSVMTEITAVSDAVDIKTMEQANINTFQLGKANHESTYYYFDKGTYKDCKIQQDLRALSTTDPNDKMGNIYIFIKQGAIVEIDEVNPPEFEITNTSQPTVNVFVIVEKGGELVLNLTRRKEDNYLYVYAKYGGVEIGANGEMVGGITCYEINEVLNHNKVNLYPGYPSNPGNKDIGGGYAIESYGN